MNLSGLNDKQLLAVTHKPGNVLVIAGPGSGKTTVIVKRIEYLINELQVLPEKILVITFTKDAAISMKNRYFEQTDGPKPVNFGTFHSVFYNILRNSKNYSQKNILNNTKKRKLIFDAIKPLGFEVDEVSGFINAVSMYKNTLDMDRASIKLDEKLSSKFEQIFINYESLRKRHGLFDFDDMVYDFLNLLVLDNKLRDKVNGYFDYILIDEFQDINASQYETVKLMSKNSYIFAVGDDDQAIYGFRGSNPSFMRLFEKDFCASTIGLEQNYRSSSSIVQDSLIVIGENKNRFEKRLFSNNDNTHDNLILSFKTVEDEYDYIFNSLDKNVNTVVLFRTNLDMQLFAFYLKSKNVDFLMREKSDGIFNNAVVSDVLSYMELGHRLSLGRLGIDDADNLIKILNRPYRALSAESIMHNSDNLIESMRGYYRDNYEKEQMVSDLCRDLLQLGKLKPFLGINYLFNKMGYKSFVEKLCNNNASKQKENQEIINFLIDVFKRYDNYIDLKNGFDELNTIYNSKQDNVLKNLYLMTVHASKGLEFDRVIIPNCNEKIYPFGSELCNETIEEERRILYVAMTRARNILELLYIFDKNRNFMLPSRFIEFLIKQKT